MSHTVRRWCPQHARVQHQDGCLKCVHFLCQIYLSKIVEILKLHQHKGHTQHSVFVHTGQCHVAMKRRGGADTRHDVDGR